MFNTKAINFTPGPGIIARLVEIPSFPVFTLIAEHNIAISLFIIYFTFHLIKIFHLCLGMNASIVS